MTEFIIVRHGETLWNESGRYQGQSDVELSEKGRHQAALLAERFPVGRLDAVYSSDLRRAVGTAAPVAKKYGLTVRREAAFRELNFGEWEGLTYSDISKKWPEAARLLFTSPDELHIPGGETFAELTARTTKKIVELTKLHDGETIGVFSHGAAIKAMVAALMHIPQKYLWSIRQDNTAVNIFTIDEGYTTALLINSTAHLSGRVISP